MLIDTHAHLTMPDFSDLDHVLNRAKSSNVHYIINASFDIDSSIKSVDLSDKYGCIFASVGVHPHHANSLSEGILKKIEQLCNSKKVVAIGETGLDYFENTVPKEQQIKAFLSHLDIAQKHNLPIILHGRDANDDMIKILKNANVKGVFHCFSGDVEYAKKIIDMGYLISFTAIITFKNAHKLREVVKSIPLDFMMLETDCPYLAPQIFRGKRNEPSYLMYIAQKISEIKGISFEKVCDVTTNSAIKFFNLQDIIYA